MKGIVCNVCGFIAINGVAPEHCPVCGAPKTVFQEKEDAIKIPQDSNNLVELEKKHVPVITIVKKCGLIPDGCVDAHVKIGLIMHPMQPQHYIIHLDFYLDKEFISRIHLTPDKLNPAGALHLKVNTGKLVVVASCNLHGNWIAETEI